MSFVPSSTTKDGVTIQLSNVDWQIQSTDLVNDVLVPASYKAIATYSGTAWYSKATGYISTAKYSGDVTSEGIGSITYTLTYTGMPIIPPEPEPTPTPTQFPVQEEEPERVSTVVQSTKPDDIDGRAEESNWLWIACGVLLALALAFGIILITVIRKQGNHEAKYYETATNHYEDQT